MDRNLGAAQVATSATDEAAYGDYFQWGRGRDGHQKAASTTTTTQSPGDNPGHNQFISGSADWRATHNDSLWQGVDGVNNPCPAGFRVPTSLELDTERLSWGSNDTGGAFASPLRLVLAGYRDKNAGAALGNLDTVAHYWSSTVNSIKANVLYFDSNSDSGTIYGNFRAYGFSVRCIKDTTPPPPTNKIIFATSSTHDGNFGGLTGADQVCQGLADAASLAGTYKAWLSDNTGSPSNRMTHADVPYVLPNGDQVASSWNDLVDGTLENKIIIDESGNALPNVFTHMWTNTTIYGTQDNNTFSCTDWTSSSSSVYGVLGYEDTTNTDWTHKSTANGCNTSHRLYCVEQ